MIKDEGESVHAQGDISPHLGNASTFKMNWETDIVFYDILFDEWHPEIGQGA